MTTNDSIEETSRCPVCQSNVNRLCLANLGLSIEELGNLEEYVKNGKMKDLLNITQIAMRWLGDPEKTNVELRIKGLEHSVHEKFAQLTEKFDGWVDDIWNKGEKDRGNAFRDLTSMKNDLLSEIRESATTIGRARTEMMREINELKQGMNAISTKIVGTGIGNVSEKIVMKDLKSAVCNTGDSFSDERALKKGTDIVSTVKDNGRDCGKISISVKNTERWDSDFMVQLKKNMRDDGTILGIIATKVFPADGCLSDQMYVPSDMEGKTVIVVKLEYAPLAYFALRHVAIHQLKTQQTLEIKDAEADEALRTFNIVMAYINGPNFQQSINHIDKTIKDAQDARNCLTQMRTYVNTNIDKSIKFQNSIEENLNGAKDLIWKLRELLNSNSPDLY